MQQNLDGLQKANQMRASLDYKLHQHTDHASGMWYDTVDVDPSGASSSEPQDLLSMSQIPRSIEEGDTRNESGAVTDLSAETASANSASNSSDTVPASYIVPRKRAGPRRQLKITSIVHTDIPGFRKASSKDVGKSARHMIRVGESVDFGLR